MDAAGNRQGRGETKPELSKAHDSISLQVQRVHVALATQAP